MRRLKKAKNEGKCQIQKKHKKLILFKYFCYDKLIEKHGYIRMWQATVAFVSDSRYEVTQPDRKQRVNEINILIFY